MAARRALLRAPSLASPLAAGTALCRPAGADCRGVAAAAPALPREALRSLPVVDVSGLRRQGAAVDSAAFRSAARALDAACRDVGFAYLAGHGVRAAVLEGARSAARTFFAQGEDYKRAHALGAAGAYRGWQRLGENVTRYGADGADDRDASSFSRDHHEAFDMYAEQDASSFPLGSWARGVNPWPASPSEFEPAMRMYVSEMEALGADVMRGLAVGLGARADAFDYALQEPFWSMRAICYPPLEPRSPGAATEGAADGGAAAGGWEVLRTGEVPRSVPISCGEHSDYGCLTFVNQDHAERASLQVKARDGTWIDAPPAIGADGEQLLVMNVGDMLTRWTNGRYIATPHRVIHTSGGSVDGGSDDSARSRISVPFFYEPSFDAVIAPLPELAAEDAHGEEYSSVVYGEHLTIKVESNFES